MPFYPSQGVSCSARSAQASPSPLAPPLATRPSGTKSERRSMPHIKADSVLPEPVEARSACGRRAGWRASLLAAAAWLAERLREPGTRQAENVERAGLIGHRSAPCEHMCASLVYHGRAGGAVKVMTTHFRPKAAIRPFSSSVPRPTERWRPRPSKPCTYVYDRGQDRAHREYIFMTEARTERTEAERAHRAHREYIFMTEASPSVPDPRPSAP